MRYNLATTTHTDTYLHTRTHARTSSSSRKALLQATFKFDWWGSNEGDFFTLKKKHKAKKKKKINLKTLNKPPGDEKNIKSSATRVFSLSL